MHLILIFLTSLLVVSFSIPPIINLAFKKRLFDDPTEARKVHSRIVPNFGGVAIFTGFLFTSSLFIPTALLPQANILMASGLILFMIGLKDDMIGLSPLVKFTAQFTNAFIIAVVADIRIRDLNGILGIGVLDYYVSIALTMIFIVGIVNAFNLIDGVDGLAASLGIMLTLLYTFLFFEAGAIGWAYLSITLSGSLVGFLFFNVTPAKIFMGDSGSLLLGFIAVVLSIKFLELSGVSTIRFGIITITSNIGLILSILIIPIFDTLRVFTLRVLKGNSPFQADSNHLHHRLLFLGFSHLQTTMILTIVNGLFIVMSIFLQYLGNAQLISLLVITVLASNGLLTLYIERYKRLLLSNQLIDKVEKEKSYGEKILDSISGN